jgi:hypothetical protein
MQARSVVRFVCIFAAVTPVVGTVALLVVRPNGSAPWSTWALIFFGAFPIWLAGEYLADRVLFRNPLAAAVERYTSGRRLSVLRLAYLLASMLLVVFVGYGLVVLYGA